MKPLSIFVFFFVLACEMIEIKTHITESRCYRTGNILRARASFSPGILQAGAVKGLSFTYSHAIQSSPNSTFDLLSRFLETIVFVFVFVSFFLLYAVVFMFISLTYQVFFHFDVLSCTPTGVSEINYLTRLVSDMTVG